MAAQMVSHRSEVSDPFALQLGIRKGRTFLFAPHLVLPKFLNFFCDIQECSDASFTVVYVQVYM